MDSKEALKIVSKYGPCPHFNLNKELGNGLIWARCQDCGDEIHQNSTQKYRNDAMQFEIAIATLDKVINPLMEMIV